MRALRSLSSLVLVFLLVEFLDEFVFGAREAAWPLMRDDLELNYLQIGIVLGVPGVISSVVEPFVGILGDIWKRRTLILGGGVVYTVALILVASSPNFLWLLLAFVLLYPASGAFVSLSQAALMDLEPDRHEQNMARWTFTGSLGIVFGPLILSVATFLEWNWRILFVVLALLTILTLLFVWRSSALVIHARKDDISEEPLTFIGFWNSTMEALRALRRAEVLRWLILLQFSDLMLDILHGYLALYFVDVVDVTPSQAALAVLIWTGAGLLGDLLLIPLLECVQGLRYLWISAWLVLAIFPLFLLAQGWILKLVLVAVLGFLNAGWYAIPKGQLYSVMPGRSGAVITLTNLFGLIGALIPLGLGWLAQHWGLDRAIWLLGLGPFVLLLGIPRFRSKINVEEV